MTIQSLPKLLEHVGRRCTSRGQWLFRGQPIDKPLLPKLVRDRSHADAVSHESEMIETFKIRARPYLAGEKMSKMEWLSLAQHSGLATRLLDWSDNPLAGLWFAVRELPKEQEHGVLWMFSVSDEDRADVNSNPYRGPRTQIFRPAHITPSIIAQGGYFTVHKYVAAEKRFVALEQNVKYKSRLQKLIVPTTCFASLRTELDVCGVNRAQLFPGLEGLASHINWTRLEIAG
jgi:FRG domain